MWVVKEKEAIGIWSLTRSLVAHITYPQHLPSNRCCSVFVCAFFFRVRELNAAKMVIEKFLPFSFFSSGSTWQWQELVGLLTSNTTHFPPLSSRGIKHLLSEMYVATKVSGSWFSGDTFGFVNVSLRHLHILGVSIRDEYLSVTIIVVT